MRVQIPLEPVGLQRRRISIKPLHGPNIQLALAHGVLGPRKRVKINMPVKMIPPQPIDKFARHRRVHAPKHQAIFRSYPLVAIIQLHAEQLSARSDLRY